MKKIRRIAKNFLALTLDSRFGGTLYLSNDTTLQPDLEIVIMAQEREFQYAASSADETLERLVAMTNQTNLVALDKTMAAIRRAPSSYAAAAARVGSIGERILRAVHEVGMTLPPHLRAS